MSSPGVRCLGTVIEILRTTLLALRALWLCQGKALLDRDASMNQLEGQVGMISYCEFVADLTDSNPLRFAPKVLRILIETGFCIAAIGAVPVFALRFAPKVLRILAPGCSKRRRRFGLPGVHHAIRACPEGAPEGRRINPRDSVRRK